MDSPDLLTVVLDHAITNPDGEALDGEVDDPRDPDLTVGTGDGLPGGPTVFQIAVLYGDANRDGVVDIADGAMVVAVLDRCLGDPGYDPLADLDNDGCVDQTDLDPVNDNWGAVLPTTDGHAPPSGAGVAMVRST